MTENRLSTPLPTSSSDARGDEIMGVTRCRRRGHGRLRRRRCRGSTGPPTSTNRLKAPLRLYRGVQMTPYEALAKTWPRRRKLPAALGRPPVPGPAPGTPGSTSRRPVPWGPAPAALVRLLGGHPARRRQLKAAWNAFSLGGSLARAHCPVVGVVPAGTRRPASAPHRRRGRRAARPAAGPWRCRAATTTPKCEGRASHACSGWHVEVHEGVVVTERSQRPLGRRRAALPRPRSPHPRSRSP